jgi:hypothetical protein
VVAQAEVEEMEIIVVAQPAAIIMETLMIIDTVIVEVFLDIMLAVAAVELQL